MKTIWILAGLCAADVSAAGFDDPWKSEAAALVLDPYAANAIDWKKLAGERRVVAVIHKATLGTQKIDPAYVARRIEAKKRATSGVHTTGACLASPKGRPTSTSTPSNRRRTS